MKKLVVLGAFLALAVVSWATPRLVVFEEVTATNWTYCPYSAVALSQLQKDARTTNMLTISYHVRSDPFQNADGVARSSFYGVTGTPTTFTDGVFSVVGSYGDIRQDSAAFANNYNRRHINASPLTISVTGKYNIVSRTGQVKATVTNTGTSTITNHKLRYVIVETIHYHWSFADSCWEICRKMLPNSSGVTISLNAGETKADSQSFTMETGWADGGTSLVAFVQNDANKEILQGGWSPLSSFTGVEGGLPAETPGNDIVLAQNRPNPSKGSADIVFSLPKSEQVRLAIYDAQGRLVRTLTEGNREAGTHHVSVSGLINGVYFYRLEAGRTSLTRRMVVAK
jgi:hypothetical protein